nr:MAG TPA: hypothetical protein [Caudoviricetes sp.]
MFKPSTRSASSFLNEEVVEEVEVPQKKVRKRARAKKVEE